MRRSIRSLIAIIMAFAITFTAIPAVGGNLDAHAASTYWKKLKVKSVSETTVTLSWSKLTKTQQKKISGIAVYRNGKLVKKLSKTAKSFTDKNLIQGKTYKYRLKTYLKTKSGSIKKYSNASAIKKATTKINTAQYPTPKNLRYSTNGNKVTVTWDPIEGADKYRVYVDFFKKGDVTEPKITFTGDGCECIVEVCAIYGSVQSKLATINVEAGGSSVDPDPGDDPEPVTGETIKITDYTGKVRTVDKNDPKVNNPQYNRNVDGTWGQKTGDYYVQKNGTTLYIPHESLNGYSVTLYNGDINKLTVEMDAQEYACRKWHDNTYGSTDGFPTTYDDVTYILGDHGRRLAYVEWRNKTSNVRGVKFTTTRYDIGTVTLTARYDGEIIDTHSLTLDSNGMIGSDGLTANGRNAYNIAKAAVPTPTNYNDDMNAVKRYVLNNYSYNQMDCWQGYAVLEAYSIVEYGEYGGQVNPQAGDPNGSISHVAFRPYSYCEAGNFTSYFEAAGRY